MDYYGDKTVRLSTGNSEKLAYMLSYIRDNHIYSFAEFIDICATDKDEWFSLLANSDFCAYIVCEYIKSLRKEEDYT